MKQDITAILKAWRFDPEANVRKIQGEDGVEKVQVRIDQGAFQGILQLNLDGRPDGHKPHGYDFALDHYRSALEKNCEDDAQFSLGQAECKELFDEGARLYERYAFLLQLKDYQRVVRDTERNMSLFRFVNRYAEQEEDRLNLEKWWPYVLRINGTARAILTGEKQDYVQALEIVEQTREQIRQCAEVDVEEFYAEQERSGRALDELERKLQAKIPLSHLQQLQRMLETAIAKEDFERAALLRDELEKLRDGSELQEGV